MMDGALADWMEISAAGRCLDVTLRGQACILSTTGGMARIKVPGNWPDTMAAAAVGLPIDALIDHPLLRGRSFVASDVSCLLGETNIESRSVSCPWRRLGGNERRRCRGSDEEIRVRKPLVQYQRNLLRDQDIRPPPLREMMLGDEVTRSCRPLEKAGGRPAKHSQFAADARVERELCITRTASPQAAGHASSRQEARRHLHGRRLSGGSGICPRPLDGMGRRSRRGPRRRGASAPDLRGWKVVRVALAPNEGVRDQTSRRWNGGGQRSRVLSSASALASAG
ncbi:hypothetical protein HD841_000946 [Sphingomonas melonis]|uniref:Uncharacterized protein n=1 Tax=Sphingomonas melonis TaxID=152682 RepID=A0A7Y9K0S0_9SPHN|nr:hypothetical protein [Sphingomonas melonis]